MDSNKKYLKKQCWKRVYKSRNSGTIKPKQSSERNKEKASDSERESEDEQTLKQPIPEAGWFPEYDSSSSSDLEEILEFSASRSKNQCNDTKWFDKELDNINLTPEITVEKNKSSPINREEVKLFHKNEEKNGTDLRSTMKNKVACKNIKAGKKSAEADGNEEEELEFLLSLKEPLHTGPTILKKTDDFNRKLPTQNTSQMEKKSVKSIDLEKWLDSVLDE